MTRRPAPLTALAGLDPEPEPRLLKELIPISYVCEQLGMTDKAVRNWRIRCGMGIRIGNRVFFRPHEVAEIARRASRTAVNVSIERELDNRKRTERKSRVRKDVWLRPEVLLEAERQADSLKLSLDDYLQALIYGNATEAWRKKLRPPLSFTER